MMGYLDWKVGDRVVCVVATDPYPDGTPWPLVQGRSYILAGITTERDLVWTIDGRSAGRIIVVLKGVDNLTGSSGFDARRFRKVQPRNTDISIFTAMLHSADQKVRA